METKLIFKIIIFGSCAALTMNSLNMSPYNEITPFIIAMILSGPISVFILFEKRYWVRAIVGILVITGAAGLIRIAVSFGRAELYGNELSHSNFTYIYHAIVCMVFISIFFVWYFGFGKKENKNDF